VTYEEFILFGTRYSRARQLAVTLSTGVALAVTGTGLASAATSAATTTVNIRSGAGTSHAVVAELVKGQRVDTAGRSRNGWVAVELGSARAYVATRYLRTGGAMPAAPTRISTSGTKIATANLNVRTGPSRSRPVVGTIPDGRRLTLTGKLSGGYAETRYAGKLRWVSIAYLANAPRRAASVPAARPAAAPRRAAPAPAARPAARPASSSSSSSSSKGQQALAFAKRQVGKPYRYGAAGPSSYDCSGLTVAAWRSAGVSLPRTSQQQYGQGRRIAKSSLQPGDLVFFYGQSPSHVAVYAGAGTIIHSPRPGRGVEYSKLSYMPFAGAVRPG